MGLKGFERRLERMVEGVFARASRSHVTPVELGRRLVREMDDQRTVNAKGDPTAPNTFVVTVGAEDHAHLAAVGESLTRELSELARDHAREEGYRLVGPVEVDLRADPELHGGSFGLSARYKEGPGGTPGGALVLPGGRRIALAHVPVVIGRAADAAVHLADSSVSRRHAEVRPGDGGFVVVDLGSTNGTRINGAKVAERLLADGDTITVGDSSLRFEAL